VSAHKDSGFILELNLPWGSTLPWQDYDGSHQQTALQCSSGQAGRSCQDGFVSVAVHASPVLTLPPNMLTIQPSNRGRQEMCIMCLHPCTATVITNSLLLA
jgi:hypothetical protein